MERLRHLDWCYSRRRELTQVSRFNLGKQPGFELEKELREFARFTAMRHDLRQMFLEILIEGVESTRG